MIYLEIQYETENKYYRFSSISKAAHYVTTHGITNWCMTDLPMYDDDSDEDMRDDEYEFIN